jgi:hypothetical protein
MSMQACLLYVKGRVSYTAQTSCRPCNELADDRADMAAQTGGVGGDIAVARESPTIPTRRSRNYWRMNYSAGTAWVRADRTGPPALWKPSPGG